MDTYEMAENKRVAIRRYELMCEQVDIMRRFCASAAASGNAKLYQDYRNEWKRVLDKSYALYYAAFGRFHPSLF